MLDPHYPDRTELFEVINRAAHAAVMAAADVINNSDAAVNYNVLSLEGADKINVALIFDEFLQDYFHKQTAQVAA